jgi:hypothetical protein
LDHRDFSVPDFQFPNETFSTSWLTAFRKHFHFLWDSTTKDAESAGAFMSYLDVYIGDLDDPSFKWDGGNWNGNVPTRLSPFFPEGGRVWRVLIDRINAGTYVGKQTDFSGFVAKVTKQEILRFLDEMYSHDMYNQLRELRQFVDNLDDKKKHALVASEL